MRTKAENATIKQISQSIVRNIKQIKASQEKKAKNIGDLATFRLGSPANEHFIQKICLTMNNLTVEDIIATYILLRRFIDKTGINLNDGDTSVFLFITALFIAKKVHSDFPDNTTYFSAIFGAETETLIELEWVFVSRLDWNLFIMEETYNESLSQLTKTVHWDSGLFNISSGAAAENSTTMAENLSNRTNNRQPTATTYWYSGLFNIFSKSRAENPRITTENETEPDVALSP